ncbi:Hypothetical predicted protein, partial [Paramuricea clavata]
MAHSINMLDLIKACAAESELDFLQESLTFMLTDEQKEAVLQQRIIFWTNAMAEDIERENPIGVVDGFMDNWTEDQRRLFNEDWANDDGLCEELEQLPEPPENQIGEGSKRKHASDDAPSKRQRPEEYFTIKSAKQVYVRKFRTTGKYKKRVYVKNLSFLLGKFAQRPNMIKVKIISDPAEYFDLLSSDQINVTDANFINEELIEVHFENVDEFVEADGKTNVVIAAFTIAHARLKLYGVLEQLNRRFLYFDTDSVIYVSKEDEWEPPTGSYLGRQLTDDELDG